MSLLWDLGLLTSEMQYFLMPQGYGAVLHFKILTGFSSNGPLS